MTTYIRPMHPEVSEDAPGTCPHCGMALEPGAPVMASVTYTCPMHPDVIEDNPGSCPDCGMALEPSDISAETAAAMSLSSRSVIANALRLNRITL